MVDLAAEVDGAGSVAVAETGGVAGGVDWVTTPEAGTGSRAFLACRPDAVEVPRVRREDDESCEAAWRVHVAVDARRMLVNQAARSLGLCCVKSNFSLSLQNCVHMMQRRAACLIRRP